MKYIFIIGNGFDLAHNLKTSYGDLMNYLMDQNPNYSHILKRKPNYKVRNKDSIQRLELFESNNTIFNRVKELKLTTGNWSDIEKVYKDLLFDEGTSKVLLNKSLADIESALSDMLKKEEEKAESIEVFNELFKSIVGEKYAISFNYTNTINLYKQYFEEIIFLHGKLNDQFNSLIFGSSLLKEQEDKLLLKDNFEYVKNLKNTKYPINRNRKKVFEIIENERFTIFTIGHSCGYSDVLFLKQLFSNESIEKIYPFYYKSFDNYSEIHTNINRILIGSSQNIKKVINGDYCIPIPSDHQARAIEVIQEFAQDVDSNKYKII